VAFGDDAIAEHPPDATERHRAGQIETERRRAALTLDTGEWKCPPSSAPAVTSGRRLVDA
jgi:hypothetical protein